MRYCAYINRVKITGLKKGMPGLVKYEENNETTYLPDTQLGGGLLVASQLVSNVQTEVRKIINTKLIIPLILFFSYLVFRHIFL